MNLFKKKENKWNITITPPVRIPNTRDETLPSIYNESDMLDFARYVIRNEYRRTCDLGICTFINEWKENPYKWEKL